MVSKKKKILFYGILATAGLGVVGVPFLVYDLVQTKKKVRYLENELMETGRQYSELYSKLCKSGNI